VQPDGKKCFKSRLKFVGTSKRKNMVIRAVSIEAYVSNCSGKAEMRN
jgi:hypothetical protein